MLEHKIKVHVKDIMGIILIYIVRSNSFCVCCGTHTCIQRWFYPFYTTVGCYKPCSNIQRNVGKDILY